MAAGFRALPLLFGTQIPPVLLEIPHMPSYERLTAWKLSYEMALQIYNATDRFPREERYGLSSQLRRAAFSVAANIAEGCAKRGRREFARYLDIAIGSVTEVEVGLRLARDRGYVDRTCGKDWRPREITPEPSRGDCYEP